MNLDKENPRAPEQGPCDQRYVIHRSLFSQLIGRATAYKRLLLTIKAEYDDVIRELKRREDEERAAQLCVTSSTSHQTSLIICKRRMSHLRDRISVLQTEASELQQQIQRQKSCRDQTRWIPGLTLSQSEDLDSLDQHLDQLQVFRSSLLDRKRLCVPLKVQTQLDSELQAVQDLRDRLRTQNHQLADLYKRLRCVCERVISWQEEEEEHHLPLQDVLRSLVDSIREDGGGQQPGPESEDRTCPQRPTPVLCPPETDGDVDAELFEDDEPSGVDTSKQLRDYLDRFVQLFDSAQYEDAALLAARSPHGVLRTEEVMDMFTGVSVPSAPVPPPLLFFRALLMTSSPGDVLSSGVSLRGVGSSLHHGVLQLVVHAVTHNKLSFSEDLGDVLTEHAQKNPVMADTCLALSTAVYEACRLQRKTALSMCRRGLIHTAAEVLEDATEEDCLWVLAHSRSPALLQLLTSPGRCRAAILSVGVACASLLAEPPLQLLALQLLDDLVGRGQGVLDKAILEDCGSSVDIWTTVATLCSGLKRADLSRVIRSVLLNQSGTRTLSPDLEGAGLMDHIFL